MRLRFCFVLFCFVFFVFFVNLSVWCLFFRNKVRVKQQRAGPSHCSEWNFAATRNYQQNEAENICCCEIPIRYNENDEASAEQR